jgi:uncharacterized protein (DUF362 family)
MGIRARYICYRKETANEGSCPDSWKRPTHRKMACGDQPVACRAKDSNKVTSRNRAVGGASGTPRVGVDMNRRQEPLNLVVQEALVTGPMPALSMSWWKTLTDELCQPSCGHLVVCPMLGDCGPVESGLFVEGSTITELLATWGARIPDLRVSVIGAHVSGQELDTAAARLGYHTLSHRPGWQLIDLGSRLTWRLADSSGDVPSVRLPSLCFEPHLFICVAQLGTHPTERMVGCLAALPRCTGQFNRSLPPRARAESAVTLLRFWRPALCILDARRVRRWDEDDSFDVSPLGRVIIGRDPLAVDAAGARLLGLEPSKVPLLAGVRRALRCPWPDVSELSPLVNPPAVSQRFIEARLRDRVRYLGWRADSAVRTALRRLNLRKVVRFTRQARGGGIHGAT